MSVKKKKSWGGGSNRLKAMESSLSFIVALWKDLVGCAEPKVAEVHRETTKATDGWLSLLAGRKK